jgi:predicted metal-dependent enzyme (double-stranded beta helix superfamily)
MDAFFTQLGQTVLERWKRQNFSLEKFPDIARAALDERPPAKHVDLPALMSDFLLNEEHPFQTDSPFGEPEIVAYSHPRFYIQLLFWMDGTTAIHQHEFSGAFHVLRGSSISAHYAFEKARSITPSMRIGQVRMKKIEILETGRTLPIVSGPKTIHSLFHLDSPSITVVVRTQHDPGTGPQLNYLPPHLAIDPHHSDLLTLRRTQLLDVLEQTDDPGYAEWVTRLIADLDFERGFFVLRHCMSHLQQLNDWDEAIEAFENRHKALAAGVAATLHEEARRDIIKGLRSTITDPDHRFFLALLMNAPTRADLLTLVKHRYPGKTPIDVILRWASELIDVSDEGVTLLDALFPETIQVEANARPALFLAALGHLMKRDKKLPPILCKLSAQDLKELQAAFAASVLSLLTAK